MHHWFQHLILAALSTLLLAGCATPVPVFPAGSAPEQTPNTPQTAAPQPLVQLPTITPDPMAVDGPTAEQQTLLATLKNHGPAPELTNETWLNSPPSRWRVCVAAW
jgi:PBP1b-binding outer membrane lipoprotein LpoB